MAGRLGETGLGDEGVYRVLDLCLECRACKAECPVGVDVARFKSESAARLAQLTTEYDPQPPFGRVDRSAIKRSLSYVGS